LPLGLILSLMVVCTLLFTGWKGWEMVYQHRVGVADHSVAAETRFARVGPASHRSRIRGASPCGSPWREVQQGQPKRSSAAGVPGRFLVVISRRRRIGGAENDAADRDSPDRKVDRPGIGIRSRAERAGAGYRPMRGEVGGTTGTVERLFAEAHRKRPNGRKIQAD